jgi:ribonuclease P protein component
LFSEGTRVRGGQLTIIYKRALCDSLRWGISVPKKKVPKATRRNRIKRQMRAAIDHYLIDHPTLLDRPIAIFIIYNHDDFIVFDDLKTNLNRLFGLVFYSKE